MKDHVETGVANQQFSRSACSQRRMGCVWTSRSYQGINNYTFTNAIFVFHPHSVWRKKGFWLILGAETRARTRRGPPLKGCWIWPPWSAWSHQVLQESFFFLTMSRCRKSARQRSRCWHLQMKRRKDMHEKKRWREKGRGKEIAFIRQPSKAFVTLVIRSWRREEEGGGGGLLK